MCENDLFKELTEAIKATTDPLANVGDAEAKYRVETDNTQAYVTARLAEYGVTPQLLGAARKAAETRKARKLAAL